ncbi:MAG TPA: SRPBCC family protein [Acidimicrobiia bacterium]|nr:SRPBCC family protein [Acidimicrobiia bacterium]
MPTAEEAVEVHVPVSTAYNQWTQFESFPHFMEGVEEVRQVTDTRNHWVAEIAGVRREFDTEITEQTPDQRIAWKTVDGPEQAGVVTFHRIDDHTTRVMLQMDIHPDGIVEKIGDKLGFVKRQVKQDMENFKEFIESRQAETGAWRGEVDRPS